MTWINELRFFNGIENEKKVFIATLVRISSQLLIKDPVSLETNWAILINTRE